MVKKFQRLVTLGLYLGGALAALGLGFYGFQGSLLFFPTHVHDDTPATEYTDLWAGKVHGWKIPAPENRGWIFHCHGNAGNISHRLHVVDAFHALGYGVILWDYRGYGKSEGRPSESGLYLDAEAMWKMAGEPSAYIMGESLGGGVASYLAEKHRPRGLILQSTFTCVPDLARLYYPLIPRLMCRFGFDTRERLGRIECPVLVMHGRNDDIIPYEHGRKLYEAAREPKTFVDLPGGHNDDPFTPEVLQALKRFLN